MDAVDNTSYDPEITSSSVKDELSGNNVRPSKESVEGNEKDFRHSMTLKSKDSVPDHHMLNTSTSQFVAYHEDKMEHISGIQNLSNARRYSGDSLESDISSVRLELPDGSEASKNDDVPASSEHNLSIVLPTEEQNKMSRILTTMQQRLNIARTDVEDLIARLNQELAVRQYLSTKVFSNFSFADMD